MWLSEQAALRRPGGTDARVGTVTIGGANAAAVTSGEKRELTVAAPGGIRWQPAAEQQVLVLETSDGERLILGAVGGEADGPLEEGELCLSCGEVKLRLCPDGIYLSGRLFLNGVELGGEEN